MSAIFRRHWIAFAVLVIAVAAQPAAVGAASDPVHGLASTVESLLAAYEKNDAPAVIALLDHRGFVVYGSDSAERVTTESGMRTLMHDDFALWHTAHFGPMREVSSRIEGNIGWVLFQVPFSAGGLPEVLVRFTTVWRRVSGAWFLMAASNTVPTVGSSAADLLKSSTK